MKVLIIEDSTEIVEAVSLCFKLRWPEASIASADRGEAGLGAMEAEMPDMVILDLGLPDMDGTEVLRQIRAFSDVPVLILTVRGEEVDVVKGLELGADDYVLKPFKPGEFLSRVKAVLRRSQGMPLEETKPFTSRNLVIDFSSRAVTLRGKPVKLTPTEYNLLYHLVRNEGRVLTSDYLLEKVWGAEYSGATDLVKVYINRLRDKLEDSAEHPELIFTERGVGYSFARQDKP